MNCLKFSLYPVSSFFYNHHLLDTHLLKIIWSRREFYFCRWHGKELRRSWLKGLGTLQSYSLMTRYIDICKCSMSTNSMWSFYRKGSTWRDACLGYMFIFIHLNILWSYCTFTDNQTWSMVIKFLRPDWLQFWALCISFMYLLLFLQILYKYKQWSQKKTSI